MQVDRNSLLWANVKKQLYPAGLIRGKEGAEKRQQLDAIDAEYLKILENRVRILKRDCTRWYMQGVAANRFASALFTCIHYVFQRNCMTVKLKISCCMLQTPKKAKAVQQVEQMEQVQVVEVVEACAKVRCTSYCSVSSSEHLVLLAVNTLRDCRRTMTQPMTCWPPAPAPSSWWVKTPIWDPDWPSWCRRSWRCTLAW